MFKKALFKSLYFWYFIVVFSWLANFTYLIIYQGKDQGLNLIKLLTVYPIFIFITIIIWKSKDLFDGKWFKKWTIFKHRDFPSFGKNLSLSIFIASAVSLFAELMIIRLHSAYFPVFAFYKNISLFSCFLGLGIGFARVRSKIISYVMVLPLFVLQILFIDAVSSSPLGKTLLNPIPEHFTMGLGGIVSYDSAFSVYIFLTLVFAFNVICFIPLGQIVAVNMEKFKNKTASYAWNLLGSLFGILVFSIISFLSTPPTVWIIIFTLALAVLMRKSTYALLVSMIFMSITLIFITSQPVNETSLYSPYQNLKIKFGGDIIFVEANKTYFQKIADFSEKNTQGKDYLKDWADYYDTPFLVKPQAEDVLIVGSGAGNDVAAALRSGAATVDAVEIDPALVRVGRLLHPEAPYSSSKVDIIVTDARTYIKNVQKDYDLIVYGVLDSHTLLSGQSSVRLDSFVYTVEAFKEAREKLKPGGVVVLTFAGGKEVVGKKLYLMLTEAFDGKKPRAYQTKNLTFIAGEDLSKNIHSVKRSVDLSEYYDRNTIKVDMATDDWPFLYMTLKKFPVSAVILILILLSVSITMLFGLLQGYKKTFTATSFFLGAGFMLVEAKGITELALYYGTTWFVNSIVISAILILGFLANFIVMKVGKLNKALIYILLIGTLFAGYYLGYDNSILYMGQLGKIIFTFLITLPIFFSGLAFSMEIKTARSISVVLFSNLIGAMVGGFLEYNSMYFGYKFLYLIAAVVYLFAFISDKVSKNSG